MGPSTVAGSEWARGWQRSWDHLEESLIPNRELAISRLIDLVEAVVGAEAVVVDLGCGTGTVARRLLDRLPGSSVIAVDVDPVLLTIATATFSGDDRVRIVDADLREPDWLGHLPDDQVDAVVTASALHWLPEPAVRRLYRDLAGLIRPGGLFAHSERMPLVDTPCLAQAAASLARSATATVGTRSSWDQWWAKAVADPVLADAFARRREVFKTTYPDDEFSPPADWHQSTLIEAGFSEAGVVYRDLAGAIVAALR